MPIYVYSGNDEFQIERAIKILKQSILDPMWAGLNYKSLMDPSLNDLVEILQTKPMILGNFLIEVKNPSLLTKKFKKKDFSHFKKEDLEEFDFALSSVADNTYLVIHLVSQDSASSMLDKTNELTKKLLKYTQESKELNGYKSYQLDKIAVWMQQYATEKNITIDKHALDLLIGNVGTDLRILCSELEKLATYAGPGKPVKKEHIHIVSDRNQDLYTLIEYWITGKTSLTLKELNKILENDHPIKLIAGLQSNISNLTVAKLYEKSGKSVDFIAKELGLNQWILTKNLQKFKRITPERFLTLKKVLLATEQQIKTGRLDPILAMEVLLTT